jgi:hypothetical protein
MKHNNLGSVDLKKLKKRVKKNKEKNEDRRSPLIIVDDRSDVIFNMNLDSGVWKGVRTSEMISDHDGRKILRWVLRKDFDEDAQEIIEEQLREVTFL